MGKLLYYDGYLAVVTLDFERIDHERAIGQLLQVDANKPLSDGTIKTLLEYEVISYDLWPYPDDMGVIKAHADASRLLDLDLAFYEHDDSDYGKYTTLGSTGLELNTYAVDVGRAKAEIIELSLCVQYLSRLYLLACGDERMAGMLPDPGNISKGISKELVLELPSYFRFSVENLKMPNTTALFEGGMIEDLDGQHTFRVPVRLFGGPIVIEPGNGGCIEIVDDPELTGSEFGRKRVAAASLLAALVNYESSTPYTYDHETLALKLRDEGSLVVVLANLMAAGKITTCPYCGRPVLMPRKTSAPFCRASHQTRYNEKARAMLAGGASVDEVAEAFPHIKRATISNWLPA